jgi:hypothetical protein
MRTEKVQICLLHWFTICTRRWLRVIFQGFAGKDCEVTDVSACFRLLRAGTTTTSCDACHRHSPTHPLIQKISCEDAATFVNIRSPAYAWKLPHCVKESPFWERDQAIKTYVWDCGQECWKKRAKFGITYFDISVYPNKSRLLSACFSHFWEHNVNTHFPRHRTQFN